MREAKWGKGRGAGKRHSRESLQFASHVPAECFLGFVKTFFSL